MHDQVFALATGSTSTADEEERMALTGVQRAFARAVQLEASGHDEEAQREYLAILSIDADHTGALNNLGGLALRTGHTSAAITAYRRAVQVHPDDPTGHVNLGNVLLRENDIAGARVCYEAALVVAPDLREAHQGMSYVFARLGDEATSRTHRDHGFRDRAVAVTPYRGSGEPIRVVVLLSAAGGNVETAYVLDDRTFEVTRVFAEYADASHGLPACALVFNAIGDADRCSAALAAARMLIASTVAPVINAPDAVLATTRVESAERLAAIPGVRAARTQLIDRAHIQDAVVDYPVMLRSPGHHNGAHFIKVDAALDLAPAATSLPGEALLAMSYLDGRGSDGLYRKYRVMAISARLYPLHLAISREWKVHYNTSETVGNAAHEAEEVSFLDDMPAVLGVNAMRALQAIVDALGLDYAGIDFGIDAEGRVLVYEANATMIVLPPERDEFAALHGHAAAKILTAVRTMLVGKVGLEPT